MPSKHNRNRIRDIGLAVVVLTAGTASSFAVRSKRQRTQMTSPIFYRTDDDSVVSAIQTEDFAANLVANPLRPSNESVQKNLPSWLRLQRSHLMEKNMEQLRSAMLSSFYTENEALKLMFAIEEAAAGNRNVMAGAAEYCLILVDTMEMGLNALIAAAFHYCSCVAAREKSLKDPRQRSFGMWDPTEDTGIHVFGTHAVEIARDASRLKKLEMVFSSIVQNPGKPSPLRSKDADNLRNLLLTDTRDWRALALRSAACLFRLRGIEKSGDKRKTPEAVRASREALYVFAPLASRLGMHRLKNELEGAAFKTLYPRQYETVTSLSRQMRYKKFGRGAVREGLVDMSAEDTQALNIGESMKLVLDSVKDEMEQVLRNDPVFSSVATDFQVAARVKEPYSMWKKMLRNGSDHVLQVPDALALRVVLSAKKMTDDEPDEVTRARERALCYYAQQLCTYRWAPVAGNPRFKDYIERPKANGYQSLHYTASADWKGEDWTLEIQIRSGEMHKVAEYGLASHWDYKSQSKTKSLGSSDDGRPPDYSSNSYLNAVQEWHWQQRSGAIQWDASPASDEPEILMDDVERRLRADRIRARTKRLAPYLEALNVAQSDLARDNVFVFISKSEDSPHAEGNIVALPSGACVLDAMRAGESLNGMSLDWRGIPSLNGRPSNLTQQLRNGDVLTVALEKEVATPLRM